MKKLIALALFVITLPNVCACQTLATGYVKSKSDGTPLAYVNITKQGRQEGTYSNEQGLFQIALDVNESLAFSAVGYKRVVLNISELRKLDFIILLEEDITELAAVTITSKKSGTQSTIEYLGYHNAKKKTRLITKTPGFQISTWVENQKKTAGFIDQILIHMVSSGKSRIRVRTYAFEPGKGVGKELTPKDFIVDIGKRNGVFTLDVSKEAISFPEEGIVIGVEFLGNVGKRNELIMENGTEVGAKIFLSKDDEQQNTWISFMGKNFEKEIYSQIYNTNCNAMIGIKARYYSD